MNWINRVKTVVSLGAGVAFSLVAVFATTSFSYAFDVTTYHYDQQRTGLNNQETTLTPAIVGSTAFRNLLTVAITGQVDAQPLVISAQTFASWGYGNTFPNDVVYIATEQNSILAIDSVTGATLLQNTFGTPVPISALPGKCTNNYNVVGITSTPVIDPAAQVMYAITYTWENNAAVYRLHKISLTSLQDVVPSLIITASQILSDKSTVVFNPSNQRQRPALLLNNGILYAGFGSFCDLNASATRGWVLGWDTNSFTPLYVALTDAETKAQANNYYLSSIWMSGFGIAADSAGNIYFQTGNSNKNQTNNYPESVLKISPDLSTLQGYFTPSNFAYLDGNDLDLGSGGLLVVPDQPSGLQFAVGAGKDGRMFLHNRAAMGGYVPGGPDVPPNVAIGGCWCGPSYFVGADQAARIVSSGGNQLKTWLLPTTPTGVLTLEATGLLLNGSQDPGFMTSVSANGTNNAIIWSVSRPSNGTLYLQATNASLNSGLSSLTDSSGNVWTFGPGTGVGGKQIFANGAQAYGGYAIELVIDSHGVAWALNLQGNWYKFTGSSWSLQSTTPPNLAVPSAPGSTITLSAGVSITDNSGNVFSFGAQASAEGNEILVNGLDPYGGYGVEVVIDTGGNAWYLNDDGSWFKFTGSGWSSQASGPKTLSPSPPGSTITVSGGGSLIDGNGNIWSFSAVKAVGGKQILLNGSPASGGSAVTLEVDSVGGIWALNLAGAWYQYSGGWVHKTAGPMVGVASPPGASIVAPSGYLPRLRQLAAGSWVSTDNNANIVPTVANGKVYVASFNTLTVWGTPGGQGGASH